MSYRQTAKINPEIPYNNDNLELLTTRGRCRSTHAAAPPSKPVVLSLKSISLHNSSHSSRQTYPPPAQSTRYYCINMSIGHNPRIRDVRDPWSRLRPSPATEKGWESLSDPGLSRLRRHGPGEIHLPSPKPTRPLAAGGKAMWDQAANFWRLHTQGGKGLEGGVVESGTGRGSEQSKEEDPRWILRSCRRHAQQNLNLRIASFLSFAQASSSSLSALFLLARLHLEVLV